MKRSDPLLACLLALFALHGSARADEHEVWMFQCMSNEGENEGPEFCTTELFMTVGLRDFLIYFVHNKNGKNPLVLTGPEDEFSGLAIQVDDRKPLKAGKCETGMCYFDLKNSSTLLKQFKKGRAARISVTARGSKLILDKTISLSGFSRIYDSFRQRRR
ncbi:MAG: invasion associated locus B family protein [Kiloniellales bacterium]|jgi:invasion protein IalB